MKTVTKDDYIFFIDTEKAESYYCATPKIIDRLAGYLPDLTQFLASLGIDIEKPVVYDLNDPSDLLYKTFGTFTYKDGYEIDFYGEDKMVSVVVYAREDIIEVVLFGVKL